MLKIKLWWKYSSIRYYFLNTKHNYSFWLKAKKVYKDIEYLKSNSIRNTSFEKIKKKRFVGYEYKGKLYLDNPGLTIKDRDVWEVLKRKKLI